MCGIIGIIGKQPISELIHIGMLQLQHRGQEAAGVFLYDPVENLHFHRTSSGLVSNLFGTEVLPTALWGIGHTRYATSGRSQIADAQPLFLKNKNGWLSLAHNGNIVNYSSLRQTLEQKGILFQTSCDTEALLHLLDQNLSNEGPFFESLCRAVREIHRQVTGAYSIVGIMTGHGIFAFRDPKGIRPLLFGRGENGSAFASETLALTNSGCHTIEDVQPGEVIFIDTNGTLHRKVLTRQRHSHCCFEYNYFAKPHTIMDGKEVYSVRSKLGRFLAEKIIQAGLAQADVVIPIPETGIVAGIAAAQHLQIPFAEGFTRLPHAGRIFIMTGQEKREGALLQKLAPIRSVFENKSVILIDDSIVRGTVSKRIIFLARQAGARRIIFASTFPPILHPCVYGIDFPCHDQLIARNKTISEICEEIGADALIYNDIQSLKEAIGLDDLCSACLTGRYPTSTEGIEVLQQLREQELKSLV
jgi:amidophosphoribosyltransferase